MHRLTFAFTSLRQPCGQSFGKTFWRQPEARFDFSIGHGKCVVKIGGVREIPHAKLIEPVQWTSAALPANHHFHIQFLCIHEIATQNTSRLCLVSFEF